MANKEDKLDVENSDGAMGSETPAADEPAPEAEPAWQQLVEQVDSHEPEGNDPVVQLVHQFKEAVQARDEWQDKYLRAAAEYANAKRRVELRAENQIWSARERVLTNILPVLDDFERAFGAVPDEVRQSSWIEGFALIQRKLLNALEREGVSEIPTHGEAFDPNLHQAVIMEEADEAASGQVLDVLQKGYLLEGRVLRPSMVKVAQ